MTAKELFEALKESGCGDDKLASARDLCKECGVAPSKADAAKVLSKIEDRGIRNVDPDGIWSEATIAKARAILGLPKMGVELESIAVDPDDVGAAEFEEEWPAEETVEVVKKKPVVRKGRAAPIKTAGPVVEDEE